MKILYSQPQSSQASALVTDGDLVFWGDANRRFRAFDADSGKVLWETVVGGIVMTGTITYAVERQAVCRDPHRRRPVGHRRSAVA